MEGDKITVVFINTGSSDNRPSKITTDVLSDDFRITFIRFCVDIETIFMIFVAGSFSPFEGRSEFLFHLIQKSSAKSIAKERVIKMGHFTPEAVITVSPFRDKAMNVRVPLKISAKGVKDHDETGSKILRHVHLEEHTGNNTGDSMKEAVKEFTVIKEEMTEIFVDGENAMPVSNVDQFK